MVDVRTGWLLGLIVGTGACFVPNPLFILSGGESTGDDSTGTSTTDTPGTSSTTEPGTGSASGTEPGTTTSTAPACGNNVHEPGEQCDDGNAVPGDGCEANCRRLFRDYAQELEGSAGAASLAVADLDYDGADDILLGFESCNGMGSCVITWLNDGTGGFSQSEIFAVSAPPARLFVADWNQDGTADILATHAGGYVSLINKIDPVPQELAFPGDLIAAIVARVDGDDLPDLVIPDEATSRVHYALANGSSFTQPNVTLTGYGPRRVAVTDADGGGGSDLLYTIDSVVAGFSVQLDFNGADIGPFTSLANNAGALVTGDFAKQPWPNVAYADPNGDTLQVFNNSDNGQFEQVSYTVTTNGAVSVLRSVRLNTDAVDNIIGLTPNGLQIFTYDAIKSLVVAGTTFPFPGDKIDVAAGDLGGDERIDLATLTTFGLYVMINQSGE